jgi:hypothetical protein
MNFRKYKGATIAGAFGTTIIVAHLILAIAFGLAASQWLSGAGIGLVLVIAASLHVILLRRRQNS